MEVLYVPKGSDDKESKFEGVVKISLLKHLERIQMLKGIQYKLNPEGKMDAGSIDSAAYAEKMYALVKERVKEVDLKFKESGQEFKSLDELEYYQEGMDLISELGNLLLGGLKLGKS